MRENCYSFVFWHLAETVLAWQGQWEPEQERGKSESEDNVSDRQVLWSTHRVKIGLSPKENYADRFLCIRLPPIMAVLGEHFESQWAGPLFLCLCLVLALKQCTFSSFALLLLWNCWAVCERVPSWGTKSCCLLYNSACLFMDSKCLLLLGLTFFWGEGFCKTPLNDCSESMNFNFSKVGALSPVYLKMGRE